MNPEFRQILVQEIPEPEPERLSRSESYSDVALGCPFIPIILACTVLSLCKRRCKCEVSVQTSLR